MRRSTETFILYNFDELWSRFSDDRCTLVLLSEREISIIVDTLRFASWPSRWVSDSGEHYPGNLLRSQGRDTDLLQALDYVEQLEAKLIMGCGADIRAGLEAIANAHDRLASNILSCCSGGGSSGTDGCGSGTGGVPGLVETPTTGLTYPTIGGEEPYTLPDGQTWPEDLFSSEQDFQDYKCAAAHQIVDGAVSTLRALGALTIANITGAAVIVGLAFAGAIAFPPAGIPILLSAIGALAGGLVVLQQLGDNIQTNRQDYICALYEGESTNAAIGAVLELIDEAMATLAFGATVQPYVRIVATFVFSTDTVNRLFNALLDYNYPGADCSGCGEGDCVNDPVADMIEVGDWGVIDAISAIDNDTIDLTITSEYRAAEDHELAQFRLKSTYFDQDCGLYINGTTYNSGPGSEADLDYNWTDPSGTSFGEGDPDAVHLVKAVSFIQASAISPGTYQLTIRLQRIAP